MQPLKFRLWMLMLVTAVLAIVINWDLQARREKQWVTAWKSAKLAKENDRAATNRFAADERRWINESASEEESAATARREMEKLEERIRVLKLNVRPDFLDDLRILVSRHQERAEWCRSMASRAADLKKKYELQPEPHRRFLP